MALQGRNEFRKVARARADHDAGHSHPAVRHRSVLRPHVPFVIEDGDLERGLEILERALDRSGAGA